MQIIHNPTLIKKAAVLLFLILVMGATVAATNSEVGVAATVISNQLVVTGPDMRYNMIGSQFVGDEVRVMSRNPVGTMVFIGSEKVYGWFPSWAVDMHGADFDQLPVWVEPMKGAILTPSG